MIDLSFSRRAHERIAPCGVLLLLTISSARAQAAPVPAEVAPAPARPAAEDAVKAPEEPAPRATPEATEKHEPLFIKGELAHPGTVRMLSRFNHAGVAIGPSFLDSSMYLGVDPGFAWYKDWGAVSLHIPLNLKAVALDGADPRYGGLEIRGADWDERAEIARFIRFATIGRKEDNLYVTLNGLRPSTLGYGMLLDSYQPLIDLNRSLTGLNFDWYNDYGGVQVQANDITFENTVMGTLAFVKPLAVLSAGLAQPSWADNIAAKTLSVGVEYMADYQAPRCILTSEHSADCVRGQGQLAGLDPATEVPLDHTFVNTRADTGRYAVKTSVVQALGTSIETKVFKDDVTDVKLYTTYHHYLNDGGGDGASLGSLGRFSLGTDWINAFRTRVAYVAYGDGFLPSYFNTNYEVAKYETNFSQRFAQATPTRYQAVFGDPENGFARPSIGLRHGYRVDAQWGLFREKRHNKQISAALGFSDSTGPYDSNFYVHVEFPMLRWMQLFGTYMRINGESIGVADDTVVLSGIRAELFTRVLHLNVHYSRTYQVVRTPGSEYHLGNAGVVNAAGVPGPFATDRLFETRDALFVQLEAGYELPN